MKKINDILIDLNKFSPDDIEFYPPVNYSEIEKFELEKNCKLPSEFKEFFLVSNGLWLMGSQIIGFDNGFNRYHLGVAYDFEHFESGNPMPNYLIPFYNDGGGNFYCLDLSNLSDDRATAPVVFWQHDVDYSKDIPEQTNDCFADWIHEVVISWNLEL